MTSFFRDRKGTAGSLSPGALLVGAMTGVLVAGCAMVGPDSVAPELNPPIQWRGETGSRTSPDPLDPTALNQ